MHPREGSRVRDLLKIFLELFEVELGGHDGFFKHFDILSFGVETAQLLKVVIQFNFLKNFGDEINSADKTFHISFESDVRVGAALPHIPL